MSECQQVAATVEVVCVLPQAQFCQRLTLSSETTAAQLLAQSGVLAFLAEHALVWPLPVGVFGQRVDDLDVYIMQHHDRLEVYRPLTRDPKDVRRRRAGLYPVGRRRPRA